MVRIAHFIKKTKWFKMKGILTISESSCSCSHKLVNVTFYSNIVEKCLNYEKYIT